MGSLEQEVGLEFFLAVGPQPRRVFGRNRQVSRMHGVQQSPARPAVSHFGGFQQHVQAALPPRRIDPTSEFAARRGGVAPMPIQRRLGVRGVICSTLWVSPTGILSLNLYIVMSPGLMRQSSALGRKKLICHGDNYSAVARNTGKTPGGWLQGAATMSASFGTVPGWMPRRSPR